jgi:hypothetical protein
MPATHEQITSIPEDTELSPRIIASVLDRSSGSDLQWMDNGASGHEREFLCEDGRRIYFNGDRWVLEAADAEWGEAIDTVDDLLAAIER